MQTAAGRRSNLNLSRSTSTFGEQTQLDAIDGVCAASSVVTDSHCMVIAQEDASARAHGLNEAPAACAPPGLLPSPYRTHSLPAHM